MNSAPCCHGSVARNRGRTLLSWIVPSATLALLPKCPACVVAYVALVTGVGISLHMAHIIREVVEVLCVVILVMIAARKVWSLAAWKP